MVLDVDFNLVKSAVKNLTNVLVIGSSIKTYYRNKAKNFTFVYVHVSKEIRK